MIRKFICLAVAGLALLDAFCARARATPAIHLPAGSVEVMVPNANGPPYLGYAPFPEIKDWRSLRIALERGPCLGTCPVYSVTISGDGAVAYEGFECIARRGRQSGQISAAAIRALVQAFRAARFFDLKPRFIASITDNPSYTVSIAFDRASKTVIDYRGQMEGMPPTVTALEDLIDRTAGTERWVGDLARRCSWDNRPPAPLKLFKPSRK